MSLDHRQRATTRAELAANLRMSGLTPEAVAGSLDRPVRAVTDALEVTDRADPALVWKVRDQLERAIRAQGDEPEPYSHLSERMRAYAQSWFDIDGA